MNPIRNEKGEWVIPSSRRPDGTWRKETVLKEGYVPPDEIKAFETKASRMKSKGIPGLPPPVEKSLKKEKNVKQQPVASAIKKASDHLEKLNISGSNISSQHQDANSLKNDQPLDSSKRLKALRKKLREIDDMSSKPNDGLTPEQLEKIARRPDIEAEILLLSQTDILHKSENEP